MKSAQTFFTVLLLACVASLAGCVPQQRIATLPARPTPAAYPAVQSTGPTAAALSWKQFFGDPYLASLIDTALAGNFDAAAALQRIEASRSDVLLARSFLRPTVNSAVIPSVRRFGRYTMDASGNMTTDNLPGTVVPAVLPDYFVGLQSAWEVDLWGRLRTRRRAAFYRLLASVEGRNVILSNLVADIAGGYYELVALDQNLRVLDTAIALQERELEVVQVQKEAGAATELAVQQFRAQLLTVRARRMETVQAIAETEARVNFLAGRFPQPVPRDTAALRSTPPALVSTGVPSELLRYRPDIRAAELEMTAADADIEAARKAFYPSLVISGSLGYQAFRTALLFNSPESIAFGVFGSLAAPVVNRAGIKADFYRANAQQIEALYNYRKAIAQGFAEVYTESLRVSNLQQTVALRAEAAGVLTGAIETSTLLFRADRATYLEVLIAQQAALEARLELVDAQRELAQARVNVYKALGGGWQ